MRILICAALLASVAAVPAMAQDHPHGGGHHDDGGDRGGPPPGGEQGGGHDGGQRPSPPPAAVARPQAPARPQGAPVANHAYGWQGQGGTRNGGPQLPGGQGGYRPQRPQFPGGQGGYRPQGPQSPGGQGGYHDGDRGSDGRHGDGGHVSGRPDNGVNVWRHDHGDHGDRGGGWNGQGGDRGRDNNWHGGWNGDHRQGGGWNSGWRNDRRYDWQGWRRSHRDYYRVGAYRAPYGYGHGYRRWGIGVQIDPVFFAQDYWIDNPGYYRLPPAYEDYRWVRYYNDALLIDIDSGTVVDEIPDFFY